MINSKHSYERLNWNELLYKPLFNIRSDKGDICDSDKELEANDDIKGRSLSLGQTTPEFGDIEAPKSFFTDIKLCNNIPSERAQPQIIISNTLQRMLNFPYNETSYMLSLTVPPDHNVINRKKKYKYFQLKIHDQIRFLRNLVYQNLRENDIKDNYYMVFEITKQGQIHCHLVANFIHHPAGFRASYASCLNVKNFKKAETNCHFVQCNKSISYYLAKIEPNEDLEDANNLSKAPRRRGLDCEARKNRNGVKIKQSLKNKNIIELI